MAVALHTLVRGAGLQQFGQRRLMAIYLTCAATIELQAMPFIPGLRAIPCLGPVHRLVWRSWDNDESSDSRPPCDPGLPSEPMTRR